jgi:glucose-1-phosphate thymidylyltransferase
LTDRRGIILAGGLGTRLKPMTNVMSKQLLPVYDKPMIYYPLSTLMLGNIRDILIISTERDLPRYRELLGDGSQWGINLNYVQQDTPAGLAEAFILGRDFVGAKPSALILGDNIFFGNELTSLMRTADLRQDTASIFAYHVNDPERYGVVEFDASQRAISIEEKPTRPRSRYAVTGLYYYDERVCDFAKEVRPSARGELEITDINRMYLEAGDLNVEILGRGYAWLDTGTNESLLDAATFIASIQKRQGLMVSCPEEIAFRNRWISEEELLRLAHAISNSDYGKYLLSIVGT